MTSALYVHCGWQRTGTTAFQALMREHRDCLAAAGIVYPERWTMPGSDAHHGIVELLEPGGPNQAAVDGFLGYLEATSGRAVLISTEELSNRMAGEKREPVLQLLMAVQEVMPVTCLWTLRRMDALLTSLYLHRLVMERPVPTPAEYFRGAAQLLRERLAGMGEFTRRLGGDAVFACYDASGSHHLDMLGKMGVPDQLGQELKIRLRGDRRNVRLSQKAAVAMLHSEEISSRTGVDISRSALRDAFRDGALRFDDDADCELVGPDVRRALHEEALEASRMAGISAYGEFFEPADIGSSSPVRLDADVLDDADLERLVDMLPAQ